jgi:TetR/AcrR family transcriptional regulator, regulator of biofilm formation and stress response
VEPARTRREKTHPGHGEGRDALLRAVLRVGARLGFASLTYRAVAAEAGVTYALVTYHFGSLDAMVREALALAAKESIERSHITLAGNEIEAFADTLGVLVSDDPEGQAFQYEIALEARRRPELLGDIRALYESYFAVIGHSLANLDLGGDPELAQLVFATLDGLVLQQLLFSDGARTDAALKLLREILVAFRRSREQSPGPAAS